MVTRALYLLRVYFLGLALLLTQTLGLLHSVVHGVGHGPLAESVVTTTVVDGTAQGDAWAVHLFVGHSNESDCRVYDQLSHADAAPVFAAVVLPLVLTPFVFSTLAGLVIARWHALFQARGPPLFLR